MSLTSVIKDKSMRSLFRSVIRYPFQDKSVQLIVPAGTRNNAVIGAAFDYLARVYLAGDKVNQNWENSVASNARDILLSEGHIEEAEEVLRIIEAVKSEAARYRSAGKLEEVFARLLIRLGILDIYYRSGVLINLFEISESDVNDLLSLYRVLKQSTLSWNRICDLNPTFGKGSFTVGGADADLYLDGCLVDLKAVQKLDGFKEHINQLVGYYILNEIDQHRTLGEGITHVGIYYARHGYFLQYSIADLIDEPGKTMLIQAFNNYSIHASSQLAFTPLNPSVQIQKTAFYKDYVVPFVVGKERETLHDFYLLPLQIAAEGSKDEFEKQLAKSIQLIMCSYPFEDIRNMTLARLENLYKNRK